MRRGRTMSAEREIIRKKNANCCAAAGAARLQRVDGDDTVEVAEDSSNDFAHLRPQERVETASDSGHRDVFDAVLLHVRAKATQRRLQRGVGRLVEVASLGDLHTRSTDDSDAQQQESTRDQGVSSSSGHSLSTATEDR